METGRPGGEPLVQSEQQAVDEAAKRRINRFIKPLAQAANSFRVIETTPRPATDRPEQRLDLQ